MADDAARIAYERGVEEMRHVEYPMLQDTTYLDHAGTTPYAASLISRFSAAMLSTLYGNPHSASPASQTSTQHIEDVRLQLLGLFNADPEEFDLVFVANATAGVKLVAEAFRDSKGGFWYRYHRDAHTSLIGVRELARESVCFGSDGEVGEWIGEEEVVEQGDKKVLFAYPAQSNLNGRRLPLDWCTEVRNKKKGVYTLLDAAALVSTSPLDLSCADTAPDFTVLSLYKMFGFPDLGALIVRRGRAAAVFDARRYFGGGTVEMVVCLKEEWHARKMGSLHERLEDGTLPVHSIVALHAAMDVHRDLFGSLERISAHTTFLAKKLYDGLEGLRHATGAEVCRIYKDPTSTYGDARTQGPIVAFNIQHQDGSWVSNAEVEKLAAVKNISLRTGGLCNPGGVASSLGLSPWEMQENFSAGQRCGNDNDILRGKPTGVIRASLGAMSTLADVRSFVAFVDEFFVEKRLPPSASPVASFVLEPPTSSRLYVESLTVYPIKSCAGFSVPPGISWDIRPEGLAWDREWCLVHQGTGAALSQKRYPKMALIRPSVDLEQGVLRVELLGVLRETSNKHEITVPLSTNPHLFTDEAVYHSTNARVCGDAIRAKTYRSSEISSFFTRALGVPCYLARFPALGGASLSARHSKAHLQKHQKVGQRQMPGAFPDAAPTPPGACVAKPILLSNESPILTISRPSLNRLNETIKAEGGKAIQAEVFRANIVVAEHPDHPPGGEEPYAEDYWRYLRIGQQYFEMLGSCRRCQMVCIDQYTAEKSQEPFVTLSKTRRFDGRVYFGVHTCHLPRVEESPLGQHATISAGDVVLPFRDDEAHHDNCLHALVG